MATLDAVESWDDEFEGNFNSLAGQSVGTTLTNASSRMSLVSESLAGADDDWNLVLQPDDDLSTNRALASAKAAGIPLPANVPQSALLGGTIKRLGKQKPRQRLDDDWDGDVEMPDGAPLQLKPPKPVAAASAASEDYDDFEELEGSLGIRFAGTRRETRNRSSSASAMSPSLGSVTAESEDDDMRGLELPEGPVDFDAMLKKRRAADAELSDLQPSPALEQPATMNVHKKSRLLTDDNDDFLDDFDLGSGGVLDSRQRNLNKNLKVKQIKPPTAPHRPATTVVFHDKATDKPMHTRSHIPRPVSGSKPASSRLATVMESSAPNAVRDRRQPAPATNSQLLKTKRSLPALRSQVPQASASRPPMPFLPPGLSSPQTQHSVAHRPMPYHLRRESDPRRGGAQSPPPRAQSRLSNAFIPDTPSRNPRQRTDLAPSALLREAAAKRTITQPARKRNYGDGNELEIFDDLPTSTTKESKFVKQPIARGPPKPLLRTAQSRTDLKDQFRRNIPDRMTTPAPPRTPASPTKGLYEPPHGQTPNYLRDTAASRIARETRLGNNNNNSRLRNDGPLLPLTTNWKAQVAARSPYSSPSAQRQKPRTKQPQLIKGIGAHVPKTEKGMVYNPQTLRWEGNENTLSHFEIPAPLETPTPTGHHPETSYMDRAIVPSASPPRPALIAPMSNAAAQGVQVNGGMVFDPRQMKWLKLKDNREVSGPLSPSVTDVDDEEDAFAGIEDLKAERAATPAAGGATAAGAHGLASPVSVAASAGVGEVHEEFDLGPRFIDLQTAEEAIWIRRSAAWFPAGGAEPRPDDGSWRWAIRDIARHDAAAAAAAAAQSWA